ncbi:MAG: terpene cyclase/mutase family protein [Firmicutes bacterium]|nr:terpene cyclase/mutase family protein [Bacillota bacterium]
MKKKREGLVSIFLILTLVLTLCLGMTGYGYGATAAKIESAFEKTGAYMVHKVKEPSFSTVGGEWLMYGLAEAGYDLPQAYVKTYQKAVEDAVESSKGVLHSRKYTEYSRVVIAYSALGLDPTDIKGYNMLEKLADFNSVIWQGINGPIYALRALDAGGYEIPKVSDIENVTTRQKLIDYILSCQLADGGWTLAYTPKEDEQENQKNKKTLKADADVTAMAMESLVPYYKQEKVKKGLDKAIVCLSKMQKANGGYDSGNFSNLESCAQVVSALSNMGINPNTDSRFKKNGKSVVDALLTYYDEKTGGFRHVNKAGGGYEPTVDQMATEQAYYALAQYFQAVPSKVQMKSLSSPKAGTLKAAWTSQKADGYQIKISGNKSFTKSVKNIYIKNGNTTAKNVAKTASDLTKGKTYYVKVRAYRTINGRKCYGAYSTVKSIAVKR